MTRVNLQDTACFICLLLVKILCLVNFLFKRIWEVNFYFDLKMNEEKEFTFSFGLTELHERVHVLEIKEYASFSQETEYSV